MRRLPLSDVQNRESQRYDASDDECQIHGIDQSGCAKWDCGAITDHGGEDDHAGNRSVHLIVHKVGCSRNRAKSIEREQ